MSWKQTRLTDRIGLSFPIAQGPFGGGLSSSALAAAVANAGGLGSFGAHHLGPDAIFEQVAEIRLQTQSAFALNLWVNDRDPGGERRTRQEYAGNLRWLEPYCQELGFDVPPFPVRVGEKRCRRRGIVTLGTATSAEEAQALEAAGVDAIVATGFEAGACEESAA
ncbi:nitronate monooxygenase [bacterium]|nr:nitronate monooxygenase [bacterium]